MVTKRIGSRKSGERSKAEASNFDADGSAAPQAKGRPSGLRQSEFQKDAREPREERKRNSTGELSSRARPGQRYANDNSPKNVLAARERLAIRRAEGRPPSTSRASACDKLARRISAQLTLGYLQPSPEEMFLELVGQVLEVKMRKADPLVAHRAMVKLLRVSKCSLDLAERLFEAAAPHAGKFGDVGIGKSMSIQRLRRDTGIAGDDGKSPGWGPT